MRPGEPRLGRTDGRPSFNRFIPAVNDPPSSRQSGFDEIFASQFTCNAYLATSSTSLDLGGHGRRWKSADRSGDPGARDRKARRPALGSPPIIAGKEQARFLERIREGM